ncbi:MAG: FHA domain-containing protein [Deltaproteobacteria bacterium]|nr:FHA domain-containing protein [Deltaproteobacteria bacterium]
MTEEKKGFKLNFEDLGELGSTRARNKTMMLTPEFTSRFRSQMLDEIVDASHDEDRIEKTRKITLNRQNLLKPGSISQGGDESDSVSELVSEQGTLDNRFGETQAEENSRDVSLTSSLDQKKKPFSVFGKSLVSEDMAKSQHSQPNPEPDSRSSPSHIKLSYAAKKGRLRGFLITYHFIQEGEFFPIYEGRLIVTNKLDEKRETNYLVINHDTIDPFHAIIRVTDGNLLVLDQLSEYGTQVTKNDGQVIVLNGDKCELTCRDKLKFGDVEFVVLLI